MIRELITYLVSIGTIFLILSTVYLYILVLVRLFFKRRHEESDSATIRILVLIPAHNEGDGLATTLESVSLAEDHDIKDTVVIADNCTDNTAEVARRYPISVLERNDLEHTGKGYALEWALSEKIDLDEYDAVLFVDADTEVDKNIFKAIEVEFSGNADAVQFYNLQESDNNELSKLLHIASLTENQFYYTPRSILGLDCLLNGTGMVIRTDVLKKNRWDSHSVTEDVDFSIRLTRRGYKIDFSPLSAVRSKAPSSYSQVKTQKVRWSSGTFSLIKDYFFPLWFDFLSKGRWKSAELACSLLLLSRPLLIYFASLLLILSLGALPSLQLTLFFLNLGIISLLGIYIFSGILFVDKGELSVSMIWHIPLYALRLFAFKFKAMLTRNSRWNRTGRQGEE